MVKDKSKLCIKRVSTKLTEHEYNKLKGFADNHNLRVSEYIRLKAIYQINQRKVDKDKIDLARVISLLYSINSQLADKFDVSDRVLDDLCKVIDELNQHYLLEVANG